MRVGKTIASNKALLNNIKLSHNLKYRGKDITSYYTDGSLFTRIADGTFSDLYLGDYFYAPVINKDKFITGDKVKCILAGFDTDILDARYSDSDVSTVVSDFIKTTEYTGYKSSLTSDELTSYIKTNHFAVVVYQSDTSISYSSVMTAYNSSNYNVGPLVPLFSNHITNLKKFTISNNVYSKCTKSGSTFSIVETANSLIQLSNFIITLPQVTGIHPCKSESSTNISGYDFFDMQLPLFKANPRSICLDNLCYTCTLDQSTSIEKANVPYVYAINKTGTSKIKSLSTENNGYFMFGAII